LGSLYYQYD